MKRKLLTLVLALAMVLTMLPTALAAGEAGTLQSQIASGEVVLDQNYQEDITIPAGTTVTLDLNNKTLSNTNGGKATLRVEGTATVKNGTITGGTSYYNIEVIAGGSLTLENVTATAGNNDSSMIDNYGTLTITSGTYTGGLNTVKNEPTGELSISSGDFTLTKGSSEGFTGVIFNYGKLEITNGTFVQAHTGAPYGQAQVIHTDKYGATSPSTKIEGGTFKNLCTKSTAWTVRETNAAVGCVTVSGGTFNKKAKYLADGIVCVSNGKDYICVKPASSIKLDQTSAQMKAGEKLTLTATVMPEDAYQGVKWKSSKSTVASVDSNGVVTAKTAGTVTITATATAGEMTATCEIAISDEVVRNENSGTIYSFLADAVTDAADGDTLTMLKSETLTAVVAINKDLTLDLGGKKLTGSTVKVSYSDHTEDEKIALKMAAGNVTIKNGQIDGRVNVYDAANVTIERDVTITSKAVKDTSKEKYNAFGIVVWGNGTYGDSACQTPVLNLYGKVNVTGTKATGISTNGTDASKPIINIYEGAEVTANKASAIYLPSGALTITGGTFTGATAVYFKSTDLNISGGTFIGNGAKAAYEFNGNGLNPTGDALVIDNCNYPNGIGNVEVTGGKFSSTNASAVASYAGNGQTEPLTGFLKGGHYTSDPSAYKAEGYYTVDSTEPGYIYTLSQTEQDDAAIVTNEKSSAVNEIENTDAKKAVDKVKNKASVSGVANALSDSAKQELVNSTVDEADRNDANKKILVEVTVTVTATDAESTGTGSKVTFTKLTYEAEPTATVSVVDENGVVTPVEGSNAKIPNSALNGQTFTISLPLPAGFEPIEIMHISSDGTRERFLKEGTEGAVKTFKVENGCAVVTVNKFSEFVLSGTQTVAAKIGDTTYGTLQDAINAAKNGDEILLLDGFDAAEKVAISGKSLTIVAGGKAFHPDNVTLGAYTTITVGYEGRYFVTYNPPVTVTPSGTPAKQPYQDVAKRFDDVPADAWFATAVYYAANNGLMNGTGDNLFSPNAPTTRGMIMTILARKSGVNTSGTPWYAAGMNWAKNAGVSDGTNPTAAVTREQLVTMLYRYAALNGMDAVTLSENLTSFADASSVSSWAVQAMQWAVGQGLIEGSNQLLRPQATATRAEVATILMRFCELLHQ